MSSYLGPRLTLASLVAVSLVLVVSPLYAQDATPNSRTAALIDDLEVPGGPAALYAQQFRLPCQVLVRPGTGVIIESVDRGASSAPLIKLGRQDMSKTLAANDVITKIDGKDINSLDDYIKALSNTNTGNVTLTVRDHATQATADWLAVASKVTVPVMAPQIAAPASDRKAHVLLIGLSDDPSIGKAIAVSLGQLKKLVMTQLPAERVNLIGLSSTHCNAKEIVQAVKGISSNDSDAILCYYLGHGAYDPRFALGDPSGGHFFWNVNGDLLRRTLFEQMLAKKARLRILITDTCNIEGNANVRYALEQITHAWAAGPAPLEQLLIYHSGILDLSATARDQYSWFTSNTGGWFTQAAIPVLATNGDWSQVIPEIQQHTSEFFKTNRQQIIANPNGIDATTLAQMTGQSDMSPVTFRMELSRDPAVNDWKVLAERQITLPVAKRIP